VLIVLGGHSLGLKAATLALSVSAHAVFALVAAHGSNEAREGTERAELATSEWALIEAPSIETSPAEPARAESGGHHHAHHTHPYPVAADHDATPHDPSMPHIPVPSRAADVRPSPAPASPDGPASAPARFVMTIGHQSGGAAGVVSVDRRNPEGESTGSSPFAEEVVDAPAKLVSGGAPAYTREAESAGVEAEVPLEIVVDGRGNVTFARALRHAGYGLDEVALRSIRSYRFQPARRSGAPVPVRMRWIMQFELR
jgi:TonB family protein